MNIVKEGVKHIYTFIIDDNGDILIHAKKKGMGKCIGVINVSELVLDGKVLFNRKTILNAVYGTMARLKNKQRGNK